MILLKQLVIGNILVELYSKKIEINLLLVNHFIKVHHVLLCFLMNQLRVIKYFTKKISNIYYFIACQKVLQVASAGLFVEIKYHEPLFSVIQYLSEYTIYGRGARIGGIQHSGDPSNSKRLIFSFQNYIFI